MRHLTGACAGAAFLFGLAGQVGAQGNLSTFGFGYPPGQLSARAQATGGGVGELDPASTLNPARGALESTRALMSASH